MTIATSQLVNNRLAVDSDCSEGQEKGQSPRSALLNMGTLTQSLTRIGLYRRPRHTVPKLIPYSRKEDYIDQIWLLDFHVLATTSKVIPGRV